MLAAWLAEDGRHRGALLRATAALGLLDRARALSGLSGDEEVPRGDRRHWRRWGGGAMAAALVAGLSLGFWPDRAERIDTRIGEIRRMPLADGSVALVNSGTTLRVAFTPAERHIDVSKGEAWFQVAHNPKRPFVVASGSYRVQAVGTAFDVRREGEAARVVVTKGVVKIWSVDSAEPRAACPRANGRSCIRAGWPCGRWNPRPRTSSWRGGKGASCSTI